MDRLVEFALRNRVVVVALLGLLLCGGGLAFAKLNIEAYPDPVPPLVDIVTQSPGQSAEEIERYVTIPVEIAMAGLPHVSAVRSSSLFGLSDIKLQFTYDLTYDQAQQLVINRLAQLDPLPNGAAPQISPASPIGEILRYRIVGPPGYSVTDLKTLQDWVLARRFKSVPGVIDVTGWGGKTKTFDVTVDRQKLVAHNLNLPQVLQVIANANINVGGQTINIGEQSAVVRGVGLIRSMDDLAGTLLSAGPSPVLLRDVASISVGNLPRLGIAGQDEADDIVQGVVLMRRGEESLPTLRRVEAELARINESGLLPPGVRIERIYDRTGLINETTTTVLRNMAMGITLIFLIQWLFLGNLRSAIIVAVTIPFALCVTALIMTARGESANLLSVGAIDFGLVVDATVIMMEALFSRLAHPVQKPAENASPGATPSHSAPPLKPRVGLLLDAAKTVNRPIFYSAAIIIAGFIPLFTLSGVEGHIFGPMARTYAYAISGGLIAAFFVCPVLTSLLLPSQVKERETWAVRQLRFYVDRLIALALAHRIIVLGVALVATLATGVAAVRLGTEFLPHLEEGNLWIRTTLPTSISLEASNAYVNAMRRTIAKRAEVETVVSQQGRPDDGTDATGFFNAEFFAPLKPEAKWPKDMTKEKLVAELNDQLHAVAPGVDISFSQYIEDNVNEAASGVKGENSVKLFGPDLATLEATAARIKAVLASVPGVSDLSVLNSLGQPTVRIDVDRNRAARAGLSVGDINAVVAAAIGGQSAGNLYEEGSDRSFPIVVRLAPEYRGDLDAIRRIPVGGNAAGGSPAPVTLADVADVKLVSGASFIYRESQSRYIPVKFAVRGRDLGGAVAEAQAKIAQQVALPPGYRLEWAGEFGQFQEALNRLSVVVPISLLAIVLLLYLNFSSFRDAAVAASVIPIALIGGVLSLFFTGTPFSISAAIGFVALFGVAAMDGILIVSAYRRSVEGGAPRLTAIREAASAQLRPVFMTCLVACVGLVPAAFATGIGSQVQKPLAIVVAGGMALTPLLALLLVPVLMSLGGERVLGRAPNAREAPAQ